MEVQLQTFHDATLFRISLVPLRLVANNTRNIIWQNPNFSSVGFCRPEQIRFISESKDVIKEEIFYIESSQNLERYTSGNFTWGSEY